MMNKDVYIIGGGSSLSNFDSTKLNDKNVIVVNNGYLIYDKAKYLVTMDYSFLTKTPLELFKKIKATKVFIVNLSLYYMQEQAGLITDTRSRTSYRLEAFDVIIKSHQTEGLGLAWNDFRTGQNSGYCAIQLAVLLGYQNIYLLGFDLSTTAKTHFHDYYSHNINKYNVVLDKYYQSFIHLINEINTKTTTKLYSCSKISKLNNLIPYKEL